MCQTFSLLRLKIRKTFLVGLLLKRKKDHNSRQNTSKVHNRITKNSNIKWILVNILSTNEFYIRNLKQKDRYQSHYKLLAECVVFRFYNALHEK